MLTTADLMRHERVVDPDDDPQTTYAHIPGRRGPGRDAPMQWRMLRRRGPQSSWTIVGDPAQSLVPQPGGDDARARRAGRPRPRRTFTLSTNYRSPSEVFARVITKVFPTPTSPAPCAPRASSRCWPSTDRAASTTRAARARWPGGAPGGTIGVICPPSLKAEVQLFAMRDPRLAAFEDRIIVVTALQAKGLSTTACWSSRRTPSSPKPRRRLQLLYVALTRATQRMVTLDDTQAWHALLAPTAR